MFNSQKEENKNNSNYLSLKTEPNSLTNKKVQYLSESLDNKNRIKNHFKLNETTNPKNNEKFIKTGNNIFSIKSRSTFNKRSNQKKHVIRLKNNMLFNRHIPGCSPYDPYLIKVCKKAIIHVKDQLPIYKEVIKKINTEFGIEEDHYYKRLANNNKLIKTYNTFDEFKTEYTKETNNKNQLNKINLESNEINSSNNIQK